MGEKTSSFVGKSGLASILISFSNSMFQQYFVKLIMIKNYFLLEKLVFVILILTKLLT